MFEIENNIQPPENRIGRIRNAGYNFTEMKIGDSVYLPGASYALNKAYWAAKKHFSRGNKKMTSKKDEGGIRIWRIQ